jgi:hypothetical protein
MSSKIRAGLYTKEKGTLLLYKEPIMPCGGFENGF